MDAAYTLESAGTREISQLEIAQGQNSSVQGRWKIRGRKESRITSIARSRM